MSKDKVEVPKTQGDIIVERLLRLDDGTARRVPIAERGVARQAAKIIQALLDAKHAVDISGISYIYAPVDVIAKPRSDDEGDAYLKGIDLQKLGD